MANGEVTFEDLGVTRERLASSHNSEVVLAGVLKRRKVESQDWLFVKATATDARNDGLIRNVKKGDARITCFHRTLPRRNFTVFYRRLTDKQIIVIGYGGHVANNNQKYDVDWADNSSTTIDLRQQARQGDEFLDAEALRELLA